MTYSEKLKSPKWQKKRLELLEQRGWKCEGCGEESKTLHVHHSYYSKDNLPWQYEDWAYKVLCEECHEIEQYRMERSHRVLALGEDMFLKISFLSYVIGEEEFSELLSNMMRAIWGMTTSCYSKGAEYQQKKVKEEVQNA